MEHEVGKAVPIYFAGVQIQAANPNECQLPRSAFRAFLTHEINTNNTSV